jgi:acyl-CoA synthetase (NDP forming)
VSIVSHSGALFDSLSRRFARAETGLARFVAVGNEVDISLVEIMEWLAADPATRVIGLVLEALDDADRFRRAAALAARNGKRIVALKVGRTQAGASAALAHSSRTAGSARAYSALFREAGVASVRSIEALAGACAILALTSEWNVAAEPLLCVSTSGAGGALVADAASECGLELAGTADGGWPELAAAALSGLSLPCAVRHPIDLGTLGDWALLRQILEALTPIYPGPVVAFSHMPPTAEMGENLFDALAARRASGGPPVMLLSPGGLAAETEARFAEAAIPVFHDTNCLMESLAALLAGGPPPTDPPPVPEQDAQRRIKVAAGIEAAQERGLKVMSEAESSAVFTWMGLPMAKSLLAADPAAAVVAAESIGFPVALKGHVPGVAHKADEGLVHLNLCDADAVRAAASRMRETASHLEGMGFLVQEMHEPVIEAILAVTRDPQLGPFALCGLGGANAETAGMTEMQPIPVDTGRLRGWLEMSGLGRRVAERLGRHAPAALDRLATVLQALALLALEQGDAVMAAEVNPMIVTADGSCVGVDSLIEIASEGETS